MFVALNPVPILIDPVALRVVPIPKLRFPVVCEDPMSILPVVVIFAIVSAFPTAVGWKYVPTNPSFVVIVCVTLKLPLMSKWYPAATSLFIETKWFPEPMSKLPLIYEFGVVIFNAVAGVRFTFPAVDAIPVKEASITALV